MKRVPPISEFENDMRSLKSLLQEMGKILYKYDFENQDTEEEYINSVFDNFDSDMEDMKTSYESYLNKQTNQK